MLRESSTALGYEVNIRAIVDPSIDSGIPHGSLLVAFCDALVLGGETGRLRSQIVASLGVGGLVDASGVIGNFSMMNRIADAIGMPMGKGSLAATAETRALLGLDRFMHE